MQYLIVIVVYNQELVSALSIKSILNSLSCLGKSTLIIWDNSENSQLDEYSEIQSKLAQSGMSITYKHTPENMSLSEIYNSLLGVVTLEHEFILLLDQDTCFGEGFFHAHKKGLSCENSVNLYLPKVIFKNRLISPAIQYIFKGFNYKALNSGLVPSNYKTAINSGMIIRYSYFRDVFPGYDSRLKFYGTDDFFMKVYSSYNKSFYVLDYQIEHDLTYSVLSDDIFNFRSRFIEAQRAFLIVYGNGTKFSLASAVVFLRKIFYTLKFKKSFFKI